ncbi:hypothetical protein SteCoe_17084 [Stentor coeruleus]|uniref:Uncharacterized protein n=1 Tax=Stentor coeruleus TaxID=5963 RepID=A0A1R2BZP6_9CILI|nr:hypothetical protein SteCoe_17084 [Stentor coeruleus]
MAYKCLQKYCPELALIECNCPNNPRFCHSHYIDHSVSSKCYSRSVDKEYAIDLMRINETKNAIIKLRDDSINLAEKMILMINNCLKNNLKFIKNKIKASSVWIYQTNSESLESINNWISNQKLIKRDQDQLNRGILKLFDLNNIICKEEYEIKIEKLEVENKKLNEKLEETTQNVKILQNELKITRNIYQEKEVDIEHLKKVQDDKLTGALNKIIFLEEERKKDEEKYRKIIFESEKECKIALENYEKLLKQSGYSENKIYRLDDGLKKSSVIRPEKRKY